MLKKAKAGMSGKQDGDAKDMAQAVLDSSRQIWLAGLGAFSRAQAEGMKVFDTLVSQGQSLESKTRRAAVDTAAAAHGAAKAKVKEVKQGVGGTWDKLEQVFEARVARALSKLGVHTQSDVERLTERVDALSEAVNALIKASGGKSARQAMPARKAAKKAVARKPGRKPAAKASKPAGRAPKPAAG
ncbi:MAG: phasin family protein [Betaproteobacteria bacterium]|nr:phasin family protein [Betaproteobacteria bacterium]